MTTDELLAECQAALPALKWKIDVCLVRGDTAAGSVYVGWYDGQMGNAFTINTGTGNGVYVVHATLAGAIAKLVRGLKRRAESLRQQAQEADELSRILGGDA